MHDSQLRAITLMVV